MPSPAGTASPVAPPIDMSALLFIVIPLALLTGGYLAVRGMRNRGPRRRSRGSTVPPAVRGGDGEGGTAPGSPPAAVPFRGWGGGRLINFEIPPELPLTVEPGTPLRFIVQPGTEVRAEGGSIPDGALRFDREGCYVVEASNGGVTERFQVRVARYDEEVQGLFRVNSSDAWSDELTPREITSRLRVNDPRLAMLATREFESVRYGRSRPGPRDFLEFLRAVGKGYARPLMLGCGNGEA